MRIIISPAKKMRVERDSLPWQELPRFLPQAEALCRALQAMDAPALQKLWACSEKIAALNIERLKEMDLRRGLSPAILAYEGLQYQYMAPQVFSEQAYAYIQEHLRILSGFYGLLRPFDGVQPYRLEMQAPLQMGEAKDLYAFWGDQIAEALFAESSCILDLASREYSLCLSRYLRPGIRMIRCVFGEEKEGRIIEKGTLCKMARGEMLRFLAEGQIKSPEEAKAFTGLEHRFDPDRSDAENYVFVRRS